MNGRAGPRLVRTGSLVVLLLAMAPNIMYVGHWGGGEHEHISSPAEAQEHAEHCHLGPSKCAGIGSASVLPQIGGVAVVLAGALLAIGWAAGQVKATGLPARVEHPPRGTILFGLA